MKTTRFKNPLISPPNGRARPEAGLLALVLSFLFVFLVAGCAGGRKPATDLIWPPPPEPPRIKFLGTISSARDVEPPSLLDRFKAILFGPPPVVNLAKPYGVAVASDGRLYVADTGWRRIMVFDSKASRFFMIGVDGPGALVKPLGVATDSAGRVYVTDTELRRVMVYDRDGAFLLAIGDVNRFEQPVGIAVNDGLRRVYVSDTRRHKIVVFDLDGNFLFEFGSRGTEDGEFNFPSNLFVDRQGKVYATDLNFRVQIFDADGKFISKFGSVGTGFGQFSMPKGIGVDSHGHIYVVDARFSNVQIFSPEGRLLLYFGELGDRQGEFYLPAGLFVDDQDRIYIADQYNKRIDIFQYVGPKEPQDQGVTG